MYKTDVEFHFFSLIGHMTLKVKANDPYFQCQLSIKQDIMLTTD